MKLRKFHNLCNRHNVYKQWLVLAYLEIPAEFPMASACLQLSVTNHATAHTRNVVNNAKKNRASKKNILKRIKYSIVSGLIFGLIVWIYCMQTAMTEIATFLSVFCVLVFSPIAYFKVFWGVKDEISFKEINKTNIKYSSRANHIYNGISV